MRADPLLRTHLRCDVLEQASGAGLRLPGGLHLKLDKHEREVLEAGTCDLEVDVFRKLLALHARWHFHHVRAVDGSKAGAARGGVAAYGEWRGVGREVHPDYRREYDEEIEGAIRWGVVGGARLPSGFETDDAECFAVLAALRRICAECDAAGRDPADQRVLLLSDCAPVVSQIESAYRAGRAEGLRATDRGAMLEAICEYRARLGMVVVFWVPSHEGQVSNAYADAVAKMHLDAPLEAGLTAGVAECVASRPCLYERQVAGEWELWDRPAFRGTRLQAEGWVAAALADGLTPGRLMAGRADFWGALAARVGRPLGVEHGDTSKAIAATALTFGLRVGEVAGVRHGDVWAKRRLAEGDGGGPCTREGRWGCAACLAARWQQAGQGPRS